MNPRREIEAQDGQRVVELPSSGSPSGLARFSGWLPAPPADPDFLRRLKYLRWEKGLAIGAIWVGYLCTVGNDSDLKLGVLTGLILGSNLVFALICSRRASPYLRDLLDLPAAHPQFPVEIRYLIHETQYGEDSGIASFVEGWMHFQGRRTSWSLPAHKSRVNHISVVLGEEGQALASGLRKHYVRWDSDGQTYGIEILPMDSIEEIGKGLRTQFFIALKDWNTLSDRIQQGADTNVWPPVTPSDALRAKLERRLARLEVWTPFLLVGAVVSYGAVLSSSFVHWWLPLSMTAIFTLSQFERSYVAFTLYKLSGLESWRNRLRYKLQGKTLWSSVGVLSGRLQLRLSMFGAEPFLQQQIAQSQSKCVFPVEIEYRCFSKVHRKDIGVVEFVDGLIRFRGQTTHFEYRPDQVECGDSSDLSHKEFAQRADPFSQVLRWEKDGVEWIAYIRPAHRFKGLGDGLAEDFLGNFWDWALATSSHPISRNIG